jgi:tRNA pseudouridine32 synthase/23S rRNA pseudouridine746 synthase
MGSNGRQDGAKVKPFVLRKTIADHDAGKACDVLARATSLSKTKIKRAMSQGAVWLQRTNSKMKRLRRATVALKPGDKLAMYYDESLLNRTAPKATCMEDHQHYSIWFKPAGLMTQGTRYGDHCSIQYQAERHFHPARTSFLVHRLDREVSGLILLAHTKQAAAQFSKMFQLGRIEKRYHVHVRGDLSRHGPCGRIDKDLDGKTALTRYEMIRYDLRQDISIASVSIETGRLHQIRRHFEMIGHPVMGDPRYGTGNKNKQGLCLAATGLAFTCPFSKVRIGIELDTEFGLPEPAR